MTHKIITNALTFNP